MFDFDKKYKELNDSFAQTLVFKVGANSGFYSEINNMIFAMLYCLDNKIKFKITSLDANFSNAKGWQEYFIPFCEEYNSVFHSKYNHRFIYEGNISEIEANKDFVEVYKKTILLTF